MPECRAYNCFETTDEAFCARCMVAVSEDIRRETVRTAFKYGRTSSECLGQIYQARIEVAQYQRIPQIEIDWLAKSDAEKLRKLIRDEVEKAKQDFAAKN